MCCRGTSLRQAMRPESRSSAIVTRPSPSKAVTKRRSRDRIGDECPGGSAVFQITFCSGPNSVGSAASSATPAPLGPRNRDQSPSPERAGSPAPREQARPRRRGRLEGGSGEDRGKKQADHHYRSPPRRPEGPDARRYVAEPRRVHAREVRPVGSKRHSGTACAARGSQSPPTRAVRIIPRRSWNSSLQRIVAGHDRPIRSVLQPPERTGVTVLV